MNKAEYKKLLKKKDKTGRDLANIVKYKQVQCTKELKELLDLTYLPSDLKRFILGSICISMDSEYVKLNLLNWKKESKKIMLKGDKLDAIVNKPIAQEERIISYVHKAGGSCNVDIVAKALGMSNDTLFLHVRRCNWLEHKRAHNLILVNRRGKLKREIYENPYSANSVYDFVFSTLVQNYSISFRDIGGDVLKFCNMNGVDVGQFLVNRNLFDTIKKHVKKYLESVGQFKGGK